MTNFKITLAFNNQLMKFFTNLKISQTHRCSQFLHPISWQVPTIFTSIFTEPCSTVPHLSSVMWEASQTACLYHFCLQYAGDHLEQWDCREMKGDLISPLFNYLKEKYGLDLGIQVITSLTSSLNTPMSTHSYYTYAHTHTCKETSFSSRTLDHTLTHSVFNSEKLKDGGHYMYFFF